MANRRLRKRVEKRGEKKGNKKAVKSGHILLPPLPFRPGTFVRLESALFFTPPGVYRFEGVSGPLAHFSVGSHRLTLHRDFLSLFIEAEESEVGPLPKAESCYERGVQEIIARYAAARDPSPTEAENVHRAVDDLLRWHSKPSAIDDGQLPSLR